MIWKSKFNQLVVQCIDFCTVILGFYLAYLTWPFLHESISDPIPPLHKVSNIQILLIFIIAFIFILLFKIFGAYKFQRFTSLISEFFIVIKASGISFLILILLIFILKLSTTPRTIIIVSFLEVNILFLIQKSIMFYIAKRYRNTNHDRKKVIIFGTGKRTKMLLEAVKSNFSWGLDVVGIITSNEKIVDSNLYEKPIIGHYHKLEELLKFYNPHEILITISTRKFDEIRFVLEVCHREGIQVRLISDFFSQLYNSIRVDQIYGFNIISFSRKPISELYEIMKRIIDIVVSLVLIIIFSPLMIIAAIGVLLSDGFPVLYSWKIVGYNRKSVTSWKFRSMYKNADEIKKRLMEENEMQGPVFKMKNDPRIFPFGKFIRKFSIDELPQLFSVLKGDLSLVGPRPPLEYEFSEFESWHRRKLSVKPGITCLWQIKGRNEITDFDEWIKLDLMYIDNRSLSLDFKIMFLTFVELIKGSGR